MSMTELKLLVGDILTGPAVQINERAAAHRRRLEKSRILDMVVCMPFCSCLQCSLEAAGFFKESRSVM